MKKIEGYNDYYVTDEGDVYSYKYTVRRKLKPRANTRGYLYVNLCKKGKYKSKSLHRLVAEAFLNNENELPQVNHIDGNKLNNNITNLEWCSASSNIKHAFETGLNTPRVGSQHHDTHLSENDVLTIRQLLVTGNSRMYIANKYKVSVSSIKNIALGYTWKHI